MSFAVAFDFERRSDLKIPIEKIKASTEAGLFVWLDCDGSDVDRAREILKDSFSLEEALIDACLALDPELRYDNRAECLHLVLVGCRVDDGHLHHDRVDALIGERFFVTIHRDDVAFIERVRGHYHEDFIRYAKSPGFLIYEMWDAMIDGYEETGGRLDALVETMQKRIFTSFDDQVFADFALLGSDLLHFRKYLAPARNVLDELGTRKSRFVPEGTQPFLLGMVSRIERILQDVMVNREILSEALNLHVAIGDHKLNRIMEKLTIVTVIFLPLTFVCGVYGMNFEFQPEFKWELGYVWFWGLVASIVATAFVLMKWARLL
jgi:magnesium transporter